MGPTIEQKADALRVQVLRELDVKELPNGIQVNWEAGVDLMDLHGPAALAEFVAVIRGQMTGAPDPEPKG